MPVVVMDVCAVVAIPCKSGMGDGQVAAARCEMGGICGCRADSSLFRHDIQAIDDDIVAKMTSGNTYSSSFVAPSDHWSVVGAVMQKYVAGQTDRAGAASEIDAYWQSQK